MGKGSAVIEAARALGGRAANRWEGLIWALLEYEPNDAQLPIIEAVRDGVRFVLMCGGERAGKSFTAVAAALTDMGPRLDGKRDERLFWIVGPDYNQARAEFLYFYNALNKGGFVEKVSMPASKTQAWVLRTVWGVVVETRTSMDVAKLASFSVNGILMVEAAQQTYETWLKCRGRVAQSRGWVFLSGTLEQGLPWYASLLRRWKGPNADGGMSFSLPTWSNTSIYPGGREDPEILALERSYSPAMFMERFGAEPRTVYGLVVPEFDYALHVRKLELVEGVPVQLAVDPAQHTYAVLFVQSIGLYTHVLDCVYAKSAVVQDVIPECKRNALWGLVDRRSGNAIDIAGTQHHADKSQVELWQELAGVSFGYRYLPLPVTIAAVRFRLSSNNTMAEPLLYFDVKLPNPEPGPEGEAMHLMSEFGLWKWPDRRVKQNEAPKPIDRANDGIKALGYYLVNRYGYHEVRPKARSSRRLPFPV